MADRTYASNWREARALTLAGETGIRWGAWNEPMPRPIPAFIDLGDKVSGMMLGLAIGDSIGNTSESLLPESRRARHGWIDNYLPNRHAEGRCIGLPSDDTQLACWTLDHLIANRRVEPHDLGIGFCQHRIYGLGSSVREFLRNFKSGVQWSHAGARSAGNGALMRIAPVLIPHLNQPSSELWGDVVLSAHLTHRDGLSTASCIGFIALLWEAIAMDAAPRGDWWLTRFLELVAPIEPESPYTSRGAPIDFNGKLTELIEKHVIPAHQSDEDVTTACSRWYSGAYCLETVPSALFILARFAHDPEAAILQAVNNTKDNDTIAAIVGAAVGALHGTSALRRDWIENLSGRTTSNDEHRVFALTKSACDVFGFTTPPCVADRAVMASALIEDDARPWPPSADLPRFSAVWIKTLGMLQQVWAGIQTDPNGCARVCFFDDHGEIFDYLGFQCSNAAEAGLRRNGFERFDSRHAQFVSLPGPVYRWSRSGDNRIYSSGRYWIPD